MADAAEDVRRDEAEPEMAQARGAEVGQPGESLRGAAETQASAQGRDEGGEVATLQAEAAALKDRLLRTMAEMENLRRRTERDVADAKAYGVTSFAREMVQAADNLQRALANLPPEAREASPALRSFIEGVELTERDMLSRLARFGVKPIETRGVRFDPNRHEALFEVPDPSVPSGTVVQQVETGYVIGERVLRPAKVGVSRGGPKAEAG